MLGFEMVDDAECWIGKVSGLPRLAVDVGMFTSSRQTMYLLNLSLRQLV